MNTDEVVQQQASTETKELERRVQELEAKVERVAYWFTDRPELDAYISPSIAAFRAYLDGLESEVGSPS